MKSTGTWPDLIACHESHGSSLEGATRHSSSIASDQNQDYSVSVQFEKYRPDVESPQGSAINSSTVCKSYMCKKEWSETLIQGIQNSVSSSIPGKLNSSLRPFSKVDHMKQSHSLHSVQSPHLLNVPVLHTNSLDDQKGTISSIDSSHGLGSHMQHVKGQ